MKALKLLCLLCLLMGGAGRAGGQTPGASATLNHLFVRNVKSIEEFLNRFNGTASHPDIKDDSHSRANNIFALVSQDMRPKDMAREEFDRRVYAFADDVIRWGGTLTCEDGSMWAEAVCDFAFPPKTVRLNLLLRRERKPNGQERWALSGVNGLKKAGFYDDSKATISPVDHEVRFMTFDDYFNNNRELSAAFRSEQHNIDELSMFLGLLRSEKFKFMQTRRVRFHFLGVPGYIITVAESKDPDALGSWCIENFEAAGEMDKLSYLNKLFGLD